MDSPLVGRPDHYNFRVTLHSLLPSVLSLSYSMCFANPNPRFTSIVANADWNFFTPGIFLQPSFGRRLHIPTYDKRRSRGGRVFQERALIQHVSFSIQKVACAYPILLGQSLIDSRLSGYFFKGFLVQTILKKNRLFGLGQRDSAVRST